MGLWIDQWMTTHTIILHSTTTTAFPTRRPGRKQGRHVDSEPGACSLATLPAEILASILSYLAPDDLGRISGTCRVLYLHSTDDRLWRRHVQENVPGQDITSSHPYTNFRELYSAHDPHWFVPKYKFWFSDTGLPGRIIITRYNQREGTIEGYQLLCQNVNTSFHTWHAPGPSIVSGFSPSLHLHHQLPAFRLSGRPHSTDPANAYESGSSSSSSGSACQDEDTRGRTGFRSEVLMEPSPTSSVKNSFSYARCLSPDDLAARASPRFPHNHVWPSPLIASDHRVLGAGLAQPMTLRLKDRARSRREVYDKAFRIHKWLMVQQFEQPIVEAGTFGAHFRSEQAGATPRYFGLPTIAKLGEEVATYSTLDPAQYTPTATKPFRGIFVGDYGGHGCEFVWINQPDDDPAAEDAFDPASVARRDGESDDDYAARQRDAQVYRGRLEAVKLTGDVNVPRGEHTFVVDDLGEAGFVREETKDPFTGARVVKSRAHIANTGFQNDTYADGELFLVTPNLLAHNWLSLGHISYLMRVDIDKFIVPGDHDAGTSV
ncbi:uncharacterized protein B0H64DRAFT_202910 [Chaetomium fimeti]|uniref:F-box domain-containing protein n=1 Tax=Chaetomium fimeti TaxID=1854472 RepID=A0AAE0LPW4_9PEZI|nr:hypothetical protein B0H64DRAFT_202910 [Chaetomium fimeti]